MNGTLVLERNVLRGLTPDEDVAKVTLEAGWNHLLVKVTQGTGGWQMAAVLCDEDGEPLEDLQFR